MKALHGNEKIEKEFGRMIPEYKSNLFCNYKFPKELYFEKKLKRLRNQGREGSSLLTLDYLEGGRKSKGSRY